MGRNTASGERGVGSKKDFSSFQYLLFMGSGHLNEHLKCGVQALGVSYDLAWERGLLGCL